VAVLEARGDLDEGAVRVITVDNPRRWLTIAG
jgi:hypothetical protein